MQGMIFFLNLKGLTRQLNILIWGKINLFPIIEELFITTYSSKKNVSLYDKIVPCAQSL